MRSSKFIFVRAPFRARRQIYSQHHRPTEGTIRRIVKKFETTGLVVDQPTPVRRRNARSDENIVAVRECVSEDSNVSIPRRAQELRLSHNSTWRILRKDLGLFPYKIQLIQKLKPNDHFQRRQFADWAQEQLEIDHDFGKNNHLYRRRPFFG